VKTKMQIPSVRTDHRNRPIPLNAQMIQGKLDIGIPAVLSEKSLGLVLPPDSVFILNRTALCTCESTPGGTRVLG
jgi:hypothetical protein